MNTSKFLFDNDFRDPGGAAKNLAALQEAEQRGFAQGVAEGRRQAAADAEAHLSAAMRRLADGAGALLAGLEGQRAQIEDEALAFAAALGRKLAGKALATESLEVVTDAARSCFQHLRGVPHLVVRVNPALVEGIESRVQRLAREHGYEGRLVVMGEPEIPLGDGRVEWADGGIVRDRSRIEAAVDQALAGSFFS